MYEDLNTNNTYHAHQAFEIDLHVREMEKKMALMNALNRIHSTGGGNGIFRRTAKRIASLIAALF